jgi:hypothetical protein
VNKSSPDSGIPLLTEVISPVSVNRGIERNLGQPAEHIGERSPERGQNRISPAPPTVSKPIQREPVAPFPTRPVSAPVEIDWARLEHQISERVLQQMMGRIDFVLEQRVRDSLADVLQTAVEGLANEIRQGLHGMLQDVIARAVSQEVARLQANRK